MPTLPTDESVEDFLGRVTPAHRREDGARLAAIIGEVTGAAPVMWGPSIIGFGTYEYRSPTNPRTRGVMPKVGFSPRKASLTLYGVKDLPEGAALLPSLGEHTEGAGCVYVRRLADVDLGILRRLVAIAWSRGDDPDPA
ncbi:DUF1801 domain-containing protein [Microbacterium chocolatum]|uniref:DUF1801 domain-containing protein n=1 Tax=Microbacterium aurantiacum TaxID=162393 RepID=UPI00338EE826